MTVPHYIPSYVMLEEHRRNVTRNVPDPDWPPAVPVPRAEEIAPLRRHLGTAFRSIADRLDPQGARSGGVHLMVMPYPDATSHPSHAPRKETHR